MVGRSRSGHIRLGFGVDGDTFVGDFGDVSVDVVRGVVDVLGTAVGKGNRVRSSDNTASISSLSSLEVSL